MQTQQLGAPDLNVTRLGYGCMLIGGFYFKRRKEKADTTQSK